MEKIKDYFNDCMPTVFMVAVMVGFFIFPLSSFAAKPQTVDMPKDKDILRIIYSGGIKGNIKPCG